MNYFDSKNWELSKSNTLSTAILDKIEEHLNFKGYIVVLHKHFCGARGPTPLSYFDFDDFKAYLDNEVKPGDIIKVWPFPETEPMIDLKYPNQNGEIPKKGAY